MNFVKGMLKRLTQCPECKEKRLLLMLALNPIKNPDNIWQVVPMDIIKINEFTFISDSCKTFSDPTDKIYKIDADCRTNIKILKYWLGFDINIAPSQVKFVNTKNEIIDDYKKTYNYKNDGIYKVVRKRPQYIYEITLSK